MDLLPAIDLRHGKAVRLQQGDARRETVYADDPLALLDRFDAAGVSRVHVVDLDAAFGEPPQRELIARMARRMPIQLGGGLRDRAAIEWALDAGCDRVVLGSLVARDPASWLPRSPPVSCPPSTSRTARCGSPAGPSGRAGASPTSAPS
jgi:phosphoribosylformimino-5-aminoimidazole carboxamide ribotide isomerase